MNDHARPALTTGTLVDVQPRRGFPYKISGPAIVLTPIHDVLAVVWYWKRGIPQAGRNVFTMFRNEVTPLDETLTDLPLSTLLTMRLDIEQATAVGRYTAENLHRLLIPLRELTSGVWTCGHCGVENAPGPLCLFCFTRRDA
ncbi:DUF6409 family protein [Streptomyces luteireticuli]|uniref:RanBP2-type domain-containing protein n=1 Tax=Streptomyces luteireticuli TaxID=173858 RepID=A0ABN0Z8T1_9ACTN